MHHDEIPTVKTLMSLFPYHIGLNTSLSEAKALMDEKNIRHLVITREDGGFSLLSERELQHHHAIYGNANTEGITIDDVCSGEAVCCDINDPIDRVLDIMAERHLGSIVVLREAELAGIITSTDICKHFASFLRKQADQANPPDIVA